MSPIKRSGTHVTFQNNTWFYLPTMTYSGAVYGQQRVIIHVLHQARIRVSKQ